MTLGRTLGALALGLGCGPAAHGAQGPDARPPNVVMVVVDTLRADRLSCYGYPRATSPFLDRLAEEGARFEQHAAQFAWTVPSMVSLFNGRYLPTARTRLLEDGPSLAETFQRAGYRTVAVVANQLLSPSGGFDRGFDRYDVGPSKLPGPREAPVDGSRDLDELIDELLALIDGAAGADPGGGEEPPWFLYVHAMDPHDPYNEWPGKPWAADLDRPSVEGAGVEGAGVGVASTGLGEWHLEQLARAENRRSPEANRAGLDQIAWRRECYDREVRQLDAELERLHGELARRGLLDHAVVTVLADHGEGLWDHVAPRGAGGRRNVSVGHFFYQTHGRVLYQEAIATPWILWGAGVTPGVVDRLTENVDVYPTLLELCGLEPVPGLDGRSVVPLLRGGDDQGAPWRRLSFSTGVRGRACVRDADSGLKLILGRGALQLEEPEAPDAQGSPGPGDGARGSPGQRVALELYDLNRDPLERVDLAAELPEEAERLRRAIEAWKAAHAVPVDPVPPDADFLEHLEQLGYVDGLDD